MPGLSRRGTHVVEQGAALLSEASGVELQLGPVEIPRAEWAENWAEQEAVLERPMALLAAGALLSGDGAFAQTAKTAAVKKSERATRPKLVVLLVVDQMRGDYVGKFRGQGSGGLKRLVTGSYGREPGPLYKSVNVLRSPWLVPWESMFIAFSSYMVMFWALAGVTTMQ